MERYNLVRTPSMFSGQDDVEMEENEEGEWVKWETVELEMNLMQATIDLLRLGIR